MKSPSPLLGFNNNVKHRGKVFHIQTEDSGVKHPHVITHLFVDGGRILKSVKTSYAEFLEDEQISVRVRQLMQEQHKAMFIALRAGKFDHLVEGGEPPAAQPSTPQPASMGEAPPVAAAPPPPPSAPSAAAPQSPPGPRPPPERGPTVREPLRARDLAPAPAAPPPLPELDLAPPSSRGSTPPASSAGPPSSMRANPTPHAARRPPSLQPPPPRMPSLTNERAVAQAPRSDPRAETMANVPASTTAAEARARLASPALELNLEALERSSGDAKPSSISSQDLRDLPPPPAAVLGGRRAATFNSGYRSIQSDPRAEPDAPRPEPSARVSRSDLGAVRPPSLTPPPSARGRPVTPPSSPGAPSRGASMERPMERRSLTPQGARYAPSRPASIFGSARPQEGNSIFGEDLISEKSLDEVILSYLAEDLGGSKPKR